MKFKLKVRPGAMTFVMWAIFIFLILQTLAQFGWINLSGSPIFFPTVIGLFLLLDQGVISISSKKNVKKPQSMLGWILTTFGVLILVGVAFTALGMSIGNSLGTLLGWVQVLTGIALLVSLITE